MAGGVKVCAGWLTGWLAEWPQRFPPVAQGAITPVPLVVVVVVGGVAGLACSLSVQQGASRGHLSQHPHPTTPTLTHGNPPHSNTQQSVQGLSPWWTLSTARCKATDHEPFEDINAT